MEYVLYEAFPERLSGFSLVRRVLILGWGMVCRAGIPSPFRRPKPAYIAANSLIIFSLAGLLLTFYPVLVAELGYRQKQNQSPVARAYFGDLLALFTPEVGVLFAPDPAFSLVIPKIEAKAKIIANVDSSNKAAYFQALKLGVAHAAGSSFPGRGETIWLFAHSTDAPWNITRLNAVFYLLKDLEVEDQVIVFFNGQRFNYRVVEKKIVAPTETDFLVNEGKEKLVLQTCWPPGTTLKRLIVLAKPAVKILNSKI